jgi:hypothetical protein
MHVSKDYGMDENFLGRELNRALAAINAEYVHVTHVPCSENVSSRNNYVFVPKIFIYSYYNYIIKYRFTLLFCFGNIVAKHISPTT